MSKRHKRREALRRRARMRFARKQRENGGYTHNGWLAGAAFSVVFLALVVAIIQVMGRWANS